MAGISVKFAITGHDQVVERLFKLSTKESKRIQRKAIRSGSRIMLAAFKAAAPVGPTGNLKSAMTTKFKTYHRSGIAVAIVGADYRVAPHQHLVEFGTADRFRKKFAMSIGQGYTGRMKAAGMFRRAFESSKSHVEARFQQALREGLDEAVLAL